MQDLTPAAAARLAELAARFGVPADAAQQQGWRR